MVVVRVSAGTTLEARVPAAAGWACAVAASVLETEARVGADAAARHQRSGARRMRRPNMKKERAGFSRPSMWYVRFLIVCQQALKDGGDGGKHSGSSGTDAIRESVVSTVLFVNRQD